MRRIPKLMMITDGALNVDFLDLSANSLTFPKGTVAIQLRNKEAESRKLLDIALMVRGISAHVGMFFLINDRIDIALASNADGIHLSEFGLSPQIPKKLNPSLIVGVSVHCIEKGLWAESEGADYVIFGPIFDTPSKVKYGPPQGLFHLEKISKNLSIPVIAVGGIFPSQAKQCIEVGAYGVAAIRAFIQSDDLKETVGDFLKSITCK